MFRLILLSLILTPFGLAANSIENKKSAVRASAILEKSDGSPAGSVDLIQTPEGVLLTATLTNLPPGVHGFHIHDTGSCKPDFSAAGGHFSPRDHAHGILSQSGGHAGDMPNIHIGADGTLKIEVLNSSISLAQAEESSLFDADGAAIVIHSGADDYRSQPSGDAGDRIACGVIAKD